MMNEKIEKKNSNASNKPICTAQNKVLWRDSRDVKKNEAFKYLQNVAKICDATRVREGRELKAASSKQNT